MTFDSTPEQPDDIARVCLRAAEIIRERGLHKGGLGQHGKARCLIGALQEVTRSEDIVESWGEWYAPAICALVRELNQLGLHIADFNDRSETTAADAIALLTRVARTAEGERR